MYTYKEARDRVIDAYFRNEIKPMNLKFCICGMLSPNSQWGSQLYCRETFPYSVQEYKEMEAALLDTLIPVGIFRNGVGTYCHPSGGYRLEKQDGYEDILFEGMCRALDVLERIHRDRGEDTSLQDTPWFAQRKLEKV